MRMKPLVLWSAAAVLAVAASSAAVSAATHGSGHDVLSTSDVSRALADAPAAASQPAPTGSPTDAGQVVTTPGGIIVVDCGKGGPELLRWVPKSGYRVDHTFNAGGGDVGIVFEAAGDRDVTVTVACAIDKVTSKYVVGSDDHGGKDDSTH